MATKDSSLKKRLIKEGIVSSVVVMVLIASGFMLSNYDDDAQSEMRARQGENDSMRSEHDTIEQDLGAGFEVISFYRLYAQNHNESFLLNRESATQQLSQLREKNHLANFSITISPITDAPQDFVHLKSSVATKSEVHLTFSAVTDSSIYSLIESLERSFPGIVAITDLKFSRTADLSSQAISDLSLHKIPSLISCDLSFAWFGMRPSDTAKSSPASAAGGGH